jgi:cell wall-associated NlpC family hydrolase
VRRVRRKGGSAALSATTASAGVVAVAPVTPLLAAPGVRHEQVSQLVLGETATLLGSEGDWHRIRCTMDGYEGWAHRGYLRELEASALARWTPSGWSQGAELDAAGARVRLPLRALVGLEDGSIVLPDGRAARVLSGRVASRSAAAADARAVRPDIWAAEHFLGAPYQWGGVTPWGADCSGLVQTTFAARAVRVPRDAHEQAGFGALVPLDGAAPGDLLFYRGEASERITHVAFLSDGESVVHSTISCGGAVRESWASGSPARARLEGRLVAARRYE